MIGLSANNQWGNLLTPLFTGFTAGYWDTTVSFAEHNDAGDGVDGEPRRRPHQSRPDA